MRLKLQSTLPFNSLLLEKSETLEFENSSDQTQALNERNKILMSPNRVYFSFPTHPWILENL
jgi:hypothetical protein